MNEISLWNPRYGLVRASGDELVIRHLLDSLSGVPVLSRLFPAERRFLIGDVGSGAGFPGIPLTVFLENCEMYLIESSGRRVSFLKNAAAVLRLGNLHILGKRAEDIMPEDVLPEDVGAENLVSEKQDPGQAIQVNGTAESGLFDVVIFRAFRPFDREILQVLMRLRKPEGWIAAYKGKMDRIMEELAPLEGCFSESRILPMTVPFMEQEERHLVLLR